MPPGQYPRCEAVSSRSMVTLQEYARRMARTGIPEL